PPAPEGSSRIVPLKPGPLPASDGSIEAPHLDVSVFARGLLDRVVTRMYFPDEPAANAADPVLCSIGAPKRRATLVAVPEPEGQLRFDIFLQGERETVFFDVSSPPGLLDGGAGRRTGGHPGQPDRHR